MAQKTTSPSDFAVPDLLDDEGNVASEFKDDDDTMILPNSKESVPIKDTAIKPLVGIFGNDVILECAVSIISGHKYWIGKISGSVCFRCYLFL